MSNEMLLELGTEEIPARFIPPAIAMMKESAEKLFMENRIRFKDMAVYGTPRRLILIARGLAEVQQDITIEVVGPPKSAAYDKDGLPTKAAVGFAKGQGVDVSDLRIKNTAKGEYICIEKHETGKKTKDILPSVLENILSAITFPKAMRWNNSGARFARPVRWVLSLFNGESLQVKFAGLDGSDISYGHHFMMPAPFNVKSIDDYTEVLEKNFVIAEPAKRRSLIEKQIAEIAVEKGGRVIHDEELLDETTFLTEYPLAICGRFDDVFLTLPKDVLITVMREHQRCFSIEGEDGRLLPYFIGISNTVPKDVNIIRNGYERVIRARLSDAKFFFDSDRKKRLEEYSGRLNQVVFISKLGSMSDKVQRLTELSEQLCDLMAWHDVKDIAKRAAQLSKADLMTDMVGEFPELQGIMGFEYAVRQGEDQGVAFAIAEHYLPKFAGDILPATSAGKILAIADKIDNIVGCFGIGKIPTGSNDPLALRRQALGILNILVEGGHFVPLAKVVWKGITVYGDRISSDKHNSILKDVLEFFKERLNTLFVTEGFRYDCVRAVLLTGIEDPYDSYLRVRSLDRFRQRGEFEPLMVSFKRVMNIIPPDFRGEVVEELLREDEEKNLFTAYMDIKEKVLEAEADLEYENAFIFMSGLKQYVDLFFDKVLVMDKDEALKNNRLGLLNNLKSLFLTLADFTQIVVEGTVNSKQ